MCLKTHPLTVWVDQRHFVGYLAVRATREFGTFDLICQTVWYSLWKTVQYALTWASVAYVVVCSAEIQCDLDKSTTSVYQIDIMSKVCVANAKGGNARQKA